MKFRIFYYTITYVLNKASHNNIVIDCHTKKSIRTKNYLQVDLRKCLTQKDVAKALDEIRGATKIVFPAGLPPHDPVRMELDNVEDLSGTQAANDVIDPSRACLWACGKKLLAGNLLSDHLGKMFWDFV